MPNRPPQSINSNYSHKQRRTWRDVGRRETKVFFLESVIFAISLMVLSAQFWRYFSLSVFGAEIDPRSQELTLLRTSILTLGIIVIAVRFNSAVNLFFRNFGIFGIVFFSFISVVWSINPPETLQHALLLLLLIVFSIAIVLRYPKAKISTLMAISSIIILGFELLNLFGNRSLSISQYRLPSLSTALVFSAWAAVENSKWRSIYILVSFILLFLGFITHTPSLEISIAGMVTGGVLYAGVKNTSDSPIRMSIIAVVCMCYIAYMLTRFGASSAEALNFIFTQMGDKSLMGYGFGTNGSSILAKFIYGLGVIGLMSASVYFLSCMVFGIFAIRQPQAALIAFFGLFAIILTRATEIDFISIETIGLMVSGLILLRK